MTDVASAAGVSHMTVSRVLNGSARVSPHTKERVEAALRQLGYRPNAAARALATGRSGQLSVVFVDTTLFGPASALFAIEQAARQEDYSVSILSLRQLDPASMTEAVAQLRAQAVDGTIIVAAHTSATVALRTVPPDLPAVVVGGAVTAGLPLVALDQEAGARLATEHLLSLGHRTVWHVAGPDDWVDARGRVKGWRKALQRAGAEVPNPLFGDWSARSGYEAGQRLAADPDVTAVFVANDHMALGLLRALTEAGRRVPRDVSVVGFDDVPESPYFPPPLTTVQQDFGLVGTQAVALLLRRMAGEVTSAKTLLAPQLVVRHSTARPQ
jgi:DNA-binding LacI/PurR family transcriptional regulator